MPPLQAYTVCELDEKLTVLFSFIRTHLKSKMLVFVSSCKQVMLECVHGHLANGT